MIGKTASRHTSEQFVSFVGDIVKGQPKRRAVHVICDNVSSHKTAPVENLPGPTSSRPYPLHPDVLVMVNQVENWFARIQPDVIRRGIFTSLKDLDKSSCNASANTTKNQNH